MQEDVTKWRKLLQEILSKSLMYILTLELVRLTFCEEWLIVMYNLGIIQYRLFFVWRNYLLHIRQSLFVLNINKTVCGLFCEPSLESILRIYGVK